MIGGLVGKGSLLDVVGLVTAKGTAITTVSNPKVTINGIKVATFPAP